MFNTATALMLVAVGLTEDAETPLGHVASFGPLDGEPATETNSIGQQVQSQRMAVVDTIARAVRMIERAEANRPEPPADDLYAAMRRLADESFQKTEGAVDNGNRTTPQ